MIKVNGTTISGAAFLLALAPVAACAQPAGQANAGRTKAAGGGTTLQQFTSRHESKMLAADTDGDGKVSKAEFVAAAKAGKGDPAKRFAKLDTNGDGMLDKSEIEAMLARRFNKLDTNGDGIASAAERTAAHAGKRKGRAADTDS